MLFARTKKFAARLPRGFILLLPLLLIPGCLGAGGHAAVFSGLVILFTLAAACRPTLVREDREDFALRALFNQTGSDFSSERTCSRTKDFTGGFNLTSHDLAGNGDGFRIDGEAAGDTAGLTVKSAGDINGDGIDDLAIGSQYNGGRARAYVILGKTSGFSDIALASLSSSDGFTISDGGVISIGPLQVSGAGDFNGDSIDDLMVSAPAATYSARGGAGITFMIPGRRSGFTDFALNTLPGADGFLIGGASIGDSMGIVLDGGGDFNGDGITDVTIASHADVTVSGKGYVVYGRSGTSSIDLNAITTSDGFNMTATTPGAYVGYAAASSTGDFNGDGLSDFLIGGYNYNATAGSSFLVFGKNSGQADVALNSWSAADGVRIDGGAGGDYTGAGATTVGDVNGDGFDDLILGATPYNGGDGRAHLVFGKASMTDLNLGSLATSDGIRIDSDPGQGNAFAATISRAGDLNADGFADFLVGAPARTANSLAGSGTAYVFFGKQSGWANLSETSLSAADGFAITGAAAGDNLGSFVAPAGDLNGDNCQDFVVSATGANSGTGSAYVIFGGK